LEPGSKETIDLSLVSLGEAAPKLLALHPESILTHREGDPQFVSQALAGGVGLIHAVNCTPYQEGARIAGRTRKAGEAARPRPAGLTERPGPG
jgi:hypothetical protein